MWNCNYISWYDVFFPGGLFPILLWVSIIVVIVLLVTRLIESQKSNKAKPSKDREDSLNILKVRYANGEISHDEFLKMQNVLLQ